MQNQKTEAYKLPDDFLVELSTQEICFAHELAVGSKQTDAYRKAYGADGYSLAALQVQACRKAAEPKIQGYLRAIRSVLDTKKLLSLDDAIADEEAFAQRAENAGNFGAAGAARDRRNKMLGHYVERVEITDLTDIRGELAEIAKISPELAEAYAKEKGISIH